MAGLAGFSSGMTLALSMATGSSGLVRVEASVSAAFFLLFRVAGLAGFSSGMILVLSSALSTAVDSAA